MICTANQLTGLYMTAKLGFNGLNSTLFISGLDLIALTENGLTILIWRSCKQITLGTRSTNFKAVFWKLMQNVLFVSSFLSFQTCLRCFQIKLKRIWNIFHKIHKILEYFNVSFFVLAYTTKLSLQWQLPVGVLCKKCS